MSNSSIAFIGAGNMADSLIHGLLAQGVDAGRIHACDIDTQKLEKLADSTGIRAVDLAGAAACDVQVLAVKPQVMDSACEELRARGGNAEALYVSIAAGIPLSALGRWLGSDRAIVRCMPNTPSLVGQGATALLANEHCSESQKQLAAEILSAAGITIWLDDESQMDIVTALSGSGPAYFFLLMEAMQQAATNMGLDRELAGRLAIQTGLGAATLASRGDADPEELRRRVSSPGGTTEQAILSYEQDGFAAMVEKAMRAAASRSKELADKAG